MSDDLTPAAKLRTAFDLFVAGESLMRQNLKRRNPDADEEEIDRLLRAWMSKRPGAEHGDGVGKVVSWPRESTEKRSES